MSHFVYPSFARCLGCSHFSAVVNDAALNIVVHVSKFLFLGLLVVELRVDLLGPRELYVALRSY